MAPAALTAFSLGYSGSGRALDRLAHAIDAAERARGFQPPRWLDIRAGRDLRVPGFRADALQSVLGPRYAWMADLANVPVLNDGAGMRLRRPEAIEELLALIQRDPRQRVIFFCACELAGHCHRRTVSQLLVRAADQHGVRLRVVDWPGGQPEVLTISATSIEIESAARDQLGRIPIPGSMSHAAAVAIPWGSVAHLRHEDRQAFALIGPARFGTHGAYLPVMYSDSSEQNVRGQRQEWLESSGMTALSSGPAGSAR